MKNQSSQSFPFYIFFLIDYDHKMHPIRKSYSPKKPEL